VKNVESNTRNDSDYIEKKVHLKHILRE
jgi:hypothetical protein